MTTPATASPRRPRARPASSATASTASSNHARAPLVRCSYDDAGRTQTVTDNETSWTFAYDADGRLTSACSGTTCSGSRMCNWVDYRYDGDGHRIQIKTIAAGGTVITTDLRYAGDTVVQESIAGSVSRTYATDDEGRIVEVCDPDCASGTIYLVTWNGHGDATGLWRQNADGTLTLANSYTYSTWGAPTATVASGFGDLGYRFLYVGASDVQWDNSFGLGLLYMHARTYSPGLARFLQPDPAGAEANLYGYARNRPTGAVDPGGLWSFNLGMTWAEFRYCLNPFHFWVCQQWAVISVKASEVAKQEIPHSKPNGRQDALRHCIWQACLASAMGWSQAMTFGNLHEEWSANPSRERLMDQWNNMWGRAVGLSTPGAPVVRHFVKPCKQLLNAGILARLAD